MTFCHIEQSFERSLNTLALSTNTAFCFVFIIFLKTPAVVFYHTWSERVSIVSSEIENGNKLIISGQKKNLVDLVDNDF